ncbi:hypothetical protein ACFLZH_01855 [Patescibacteria group bacterium]
MKIKNILKIGITALILIVNLLSNTAFAQTQPIGEIKPDVDDLLYKFTSDFTAQPTTTDYIASLPEDRSPGHIFSQIIFYMLVLANVLTFVGLIVSGIMMVASQGNDEELTKAKRMFTYTIIALIVCATSLALVTGITKLNFFSP